MGFRWGAATDVGRLRSVNEDSVLAVTPLFAVADGMGGHVGGEIASEVALATLRERFGASEHPTTESLVQAVRDANTAIYDRAVAEVRLRGMGTTLTAVAVVDRDGDERLAVVNVGDSRAYVLQDGALRQITRDHTYVEDLVSAGEITAEEARFHPQRHIVTRALGIEPDVQVDAWEAPPGAGDRYLVCSDGLFNEVDDGQISAVLTGTADPQDAAERLVRLANDAGGRDNITVIVLDVTGDGQPRPDREPAAVTVDVDEGPPTEAIATPVGLASPDGTPPVGGWLDPEQQATTQHAAMPPPSSPPEPPPPQEPKRRRVTWRAVLFVAAIVAIVAIAIGGITYYGRSGYYVGFVGDQVAVFKGQKGGVLWVDPTIEATYSLRRGDLSPAWQQNLDRTISFTSRAAADAWFDTLRSNPAAVPSLATTTTTVVVTTATAAPVPTVPTTEVTGP